MDWTDVKVPGFMWVVLLVAVIWYAENHLTNPAIVELVVVVVFAILKTTALGTDDVEKLIEIARRLLESQPQTRSRSALPAVSREDIDRRRPNKLVRFFLG